MSDVREVGEESLDSGGGPRGLRPDQSIQGSLRPPGSKSLAIRALLSAGLAQGTTRIEAMPEGADVAACEGLLGTAGIRATRIKPTVLEVQGQSPARGEFWKPSGPLECGESGTLARLITAILGFCAHPGAHRISVSGTLLKRFSEPLIETLNSAGVRSVSDGDQGTWPLVLEPASAAETLMLSSPVSSQELSGLLIGLGAQTSSPRGRSVLVMGGLPSEPYAEMTAAVLKWFGADVVHQGAEWRVSGPLVAPETPIEIETDASGAAVALAAGCLSGGEVRVPGFHETSWQGDLAIVDLLGAFGCEVHRQGSELIASGRPTRAADLDLTDTPDLAPVLAAVAGAFALSRGAGAEATRLAGLETLNGKESRRIEVLTHGLRSLGIEVEADEEQMVIGAARPTSAPGKLVLDSHGDHRMAFAFALLGLVRPQLFVSDPGCVSKSWPSFWEALQSASTPA